jgi:hypothetical protein
MPRVRTEHTPDNDPQVRELLREGLLADDILLIDCRYCGGVSYYSGGFTSGCSWCGRDIALDSDEAYTLWDWWGMDRPDRP